MKIGIVTEWFARGAAYVSRQYRDALVRQGHEVVIYARGDTQTDLSDIWREPEVWVGRPSRIGQPKAVDFWDFRRWVRNEQPNWIIFNEQHWIPPVLWARDLGVRTAAYVDYYRLDTIADFMAYEVLFCHTRRHHAAFSWHPGAHYIPWGTDLELFRPNDSETEGPLTFFHSSGWSPERKGTADVVKAWLGLPSTSRLLIHGQSDPRPYLAKTTGLDLASPSFWDRLEVVVGTVEPPGLYSRGHVYVYPSRLEGIGLTQYEALASGLPLIVPNQPPMNEAACDPVSRLLPIYRELQRQDGYYWFESRTRVSDLESAMSYFVQTAPDRRSWVNATRAFAEEYLDWYANASDLGSILGDAAPVEFDSSYFERCLGWATGLSPKTLSTLGSAYARVAKARVIRRA